MTFFPLDRSIVTSKMKSMTRSELIELIAKRFPSVDRRCAEQMVKEVIASMTQALVSGNRIELRGFGSFGVKRLKPRTGRNPKSGITVEVPAKCRPYFRAGKELRERIQATADVSVLKRAA
jgi:integration host factor subunit beta